MKIKTQYNVSTLLLVTLVVALISFAMIKIYDWQTVNDITGRQPTICEVHGLKMQKQ